MMKRKGFKTGVMQSWQIFEEEDCLSGLKAKESRMTYTSAMPPVLLMTDPPYIASSHIEDPVGKPCYFSPSDQL